jgi:hypothetical protein
LGVIACVDVQLRCKLKPKITLHEMINAECGGCGSGKGWHTAVL